MVDSPRRFAENADVLNISDVLTKYFVVTNKVNDDFNISAELLVDFVNSQISGRIFEGVYNSGSNSYVISTGGLSYSRLLQVGNVVKINVTQGNLLPAPSLVIDGNAPKSIKTQLGFDISKNGLRFGECWFRYNGDDWVFINPIESEDSYIIKDSIVSEIPIGYFPLDGTEDINNYPRLLAKFGNLPNLQDKYRRNIGTKLANVLNTHTDAMQKMTGEFETSTGLSERNGLSLLKATGIFALSKIKTSANDVHDPSPTTGGKVGLELIIDTSLGARTSTETRVNSVGVKFLINV